MSQAIVDHLLTCLQRDNLIRQHEARIAQLEDALTRRIRDEVSESLFGVLVEPICNQDKPTKGTHEQGNLMTADATKPPKPSSDHQPETRGAGHAPSSAAPHGTTSGAMHSSHAGASRSTTGYATFSKPYREDTDEIALLEDAPPVATGKRVLIVDEDEEEEASRPARRVGCLFFFCVNCMCRAAHTHTPSFSFDPAFPFRPEPVCRSTSRAPRWTSGMPTRFGFRARPVLC